MSDQGPLIRVALARDAADLHAAQRLRYEVFIRELGGAGDLVDHAAELEIDRFDPVCDHLLARDARSGAVVGVYRLLRDDQAARAGQFYSEDEYDLDPLRRSGRKLLELGRSCLHPEYRGGAVMWHLWSALARYVEKNDIEILFGVASFHGTDIARLAPPLSLLHHAHRAPEALRPKARPPRAQRMDLLPADGIDRVAAMVQMPALIKAYLRLGGGVGEGAWIDTAFNTTDICLVLDTARMNARQRRLYMAPPA